METGKRLLVLFSVMINDMKPLNPNKILLEKFAGDLTLNVS